VHHAPLEDRDLGDQVRRRTEPVEPEALRVLGHPIGTVADQPGTEQRRRRHDAASAR
jgi:hypothetical protein